MTAQTITDRSVRNGVFTATRAEDGLPRPVPVAIEESSRRGRRAIGVGPRRPRRPRDHWRCRPRFWKADFGPRAPRMTPRPSRPRRISQQPKPPGAPISPVSSPYAPPSHPVRRQVGGFTDRVDPGADRPGRPRPQALHRSVALGGIWTRIHGIGRSGVATLGIGPDRRADHRVCRSLSQRPCSRAYPGRGSLRHGRTADGSGVRRHHGRGLSDP